MFHITVIMCLLFVAVSITVNVIPLKCPEYSTWIYRAKTVCNVSNYTCLFDDNQKMFVEQCISPDFLGPGFKFVVRGLIDRETCDVGRFQPFIHWTNESSDCAYQKTLCNEEGQVIFTNGSTSTERTCRCDYTQNYTYVMTPKALCSCNPREEDCSCHITNCLSGHILSPGYECVSINKSAAPFDCPEIMEQQPRIRTTEEDIMITHAKNKLKAPLINHREKGKTSTLLILAIMTGLLLILKLLQKKFDYIEWFSGLLRTYRPDYEEETPKRTEAKQEFNELKTIIKHSNIRNNYHVENNTNGNRQMVSENIAATAKQNGNGGQTHSSEKLSKIMVLVDRLGLKEYYPDKMQLSDAMKIKSKSTPALSELAFYFVKNLIMANFTCRDKLVQDYIKQIKQASQEVSENLQNKLPGALDNLFGEDDNDKADDTVINPLDLTLTVFRCSSPILKTLIATKLRMCQLAIPFVYPTPESECVSVSYWPLRGVIIDSKVDKRLTQKMSVDCPSQIISCIRLGRPSVSKSKLINEVINDEYHNTFFNKDCALGTSKRCISDGLIEAAWYIPTGKLKFMNSITMFLNLRGDGLHFSKQIQLLSKLSTVVIVFLEMNLLESPKIREQLFSLYECKSGVLLAIDANTYSKISLKEKLQIFFEAADQQKRQMRVSILTVDGATRSISTIKDDMRKAVGELAKTGTLWSLSERLTKLNITLDEDEDICRTVKQEVYSIMDLIPDKCLNSKEQVLPLQGKLWRSYSQKLKSIYILLQNESLHEAVKIIDQMNAERMKQAEICNKLGPFMKRYLDFLLKSFQSDMEFQFFVSWTKMVLDERSRTVLPDLLSKYRSDWQALKDACDKNEINSIQQLQNKLEKSEYNVADASFGFEHLCRELGQMFEALSVSKLGSSQIQNIQKSLPDIAVKLLMIGEPFEVMDGDTANVPILWVKSVLLRLKAALGDKKILALSVLGIQSSGKSTLLNTMFGLQCAVSAGRCTKGVFMQLVQVADKTISFDYVLVIDTEGLGAPELTHKKHRYDQELATFVIGLGDITIVNIKGESTAELKDILQISVHSLLRLKLANKRLNRKQSCIFIHQNVPATDANDKLMQSRQKFVEFLDEITKEAAVQENIADIKFFNQVIKFNCEQHVWYFSDLWLGDPPMAPVNPGYTENVSSVKEALLFQLAAKRVKYLTIADTINRIEYLWNGIMKGFENCELSVYNIV